MSAPTVPRRYVVAGLATLSLVGGGAVVANVASADASAPLASGGSSSSAPARPAAPPAPRPHLDGTVTGASGDTITIKDPAGFTRQIAVGPSTTYTLDGKASSLGAATTGRYVHADGTVDRNGTSLDASTVAILTSAPKPSAGPAGGPGAPAGPGGPAGLPRPGGRAPKNLPKPGTKAPSGAPKPGGKAPSGAPKLPAPSSTATTHGS